MALDDSCDSGDSQVLAAPMLLPPEVHKAAHMGLSQPVCEFLLARGDIDAKDEQMKGTMLMAAAACQQIEIVDLLLQAGASVNLMDAWGCTALSSASCPLDYQPIRAKLADDTAPTESRQAIVLRLLNAEANPNMQDRLGLTALMVASISGEVGCVKNLLQAGARRDLCEDNGNTALTLAETYGQHLAVKVLKAPPVGSGGGGRKQRMLGLVAAHPSARSQDARTLPDARTHARRAPPPDRLA